MPNTPVVSHRPPVIMRITISIILLVVGILILTAPNFAFEYKFDEFVRSLAAGWIAYILYYWFSRRLKSPGIDP